MSGWVGRWIGGTWMSDWENKVEWVNEQLREWRKEWMSCWVDDGVNVCSSTTGGWNCPQEQTGVYLPSQSGLFFLKFKQYWIILFFFFNFYCICSFQPTSNSHWCLVLWTFSFAWFLSPKDSLFYIFYCKVFLIDPYLILFNRYIV